MHRIAGKTVKREPRQARCVPAVTDGTNLGVVFYERFFYLGKLTNFKNGTLNIIGVLLPHPKSKYKTLSS